MIYKGTFKKTKWFTQELLAKLRFPADMATRFASILEVSVDELICVSGSVTTDLQPNRSLNKRMKEIDSMPESQRKFTVDPIV